MEKISPEFASALIKATSEIGAVVKDASNPFFKSKYADLEAVIGVIKEPLIKHGITFLQTVVPDITAKVNTLLIYKTGEVFDGGTIAVPLNKQDAQGYGGAITYARRYALQTLLGVPAIDDDGNTATGLDQRAKDEAAAHKARIEAENKGLAGRKEPSLGEYEYTPEPVIAKTTVVFPYDLTTAIKDKMYGKYTPAQWEAKFTEKGKAQIKPHYWILSAAVPALEEFRVKGK